MAPTAARIQSAVEQDFTKLLRDTARATRFYVRIADAARAIAAFAKFRAALGEQIGSDAGG